MTSLRSTLSSVVFLLSVIIASEAKIETLKVAYDTRNVFHIESFGFEPGGHFELNIKDFKVLYDATLVKEQEDYRTAFVLQRAGSDEGVRIEQTYQTEDTCFHESVSEADDATVFLLKKADWDANKKFVQEIKEPGYYHLYFSRCDKATVVSFEIQFVEYNVEADGRTPNYLSAGESSLPTWFFVISLAFVIEGVIWIQYLIRRREDIRSIHHLMTAVLFLKLATVFFESFEYHYIKTTGSAHGWNIVYYIFSFLKGMMMFGVIVLIGTGWSYMKPFLTERDKQLMLAVIVIQGMVNLAAVVLDETSPGDKDFLTWRDLLHLLDMVCCCFILLPIVWSIRHLKEAAEVDGKAARNVLRLQRFRKFYVSVVSYIYFTRIIVFLLGATLPFEWVWVATVFRELAALLFYGTTGYLFRPQSNNPYLEISQDDEGPDSASDSVQMTSVMRE